jgi:hypothetical protein
MGVRVVKGARLKSLGESSRSLQTIALGETVGNVANIPRFELAASKSIRSRDIGRIQQMANGLHKESVGEETNPLPNRHPSKSE